VDDDNSFAAASLPEDFDAASPEYPSLSPSIPASFSLTTQIQRLSTESKSQNHQLTLFRSKTSDQPPLPPLPPPRPPTLIPRAAPSSSKSTIRKVATNFGTIKQLSDEQHFHYEPSNKSTGEPITSLSSSSSSAEQNDIESNSSNSVHLALRVQLRKSK